MNVSIPHKRVLGFFQLVMLNVIAVDSIRSLPFSAAYGFSLVFFYVLAALFFFLPMALVSAELGTGWPTTGGIYVWVREAFGKKWSLVAIWLNWAYNVVWYPTIIAFIAGTIAYFFDPALAANKMYMAVSVLVLFWICTWVNLHGMKVSSFISTLGAIVGTLLPMMIIIMLGIYWWSKGKPTNITVSWNTLLPTLADENNLAFLTNVLFALLGLEMSATHAAEMKSPQKDYPRALLVSGVIILSSIILSSLSIALVIPSKELNLATGAMQAFSVFCHTFGIPWGIPLVAICIILGGVSAVSAWVIGPTKGLMVASHDGSLPAFFGKMNRHRVPVNILITQAIIVSVLSLFFILMPTVNSSFWVLSAITAQLALIFYIFLFLSALKLHHCKPDVARSFRVPGNSIGMWLCCLSGVISSLVVISLGFIPPEQVGIQNLWSYELTLFGGIATFILVPLFIIKKRKKAFF